MLPKFSALGQANMIDLIIGSLIFLLLASIGLLVLDNRLASVERQTISLDLEKNSENALNNLVQTPGLTTADATDWENASELIEVKFFGLAQSDRILLREKVNKFIQYADANYEGTKSKLILGYDFYFRLLESGGPASGTVLEECDTGVYPNDECMAGKSVDTLRAGGARIAEAIKSTRIVAYKGGEVIAELTVFKAI